MKRPTFFSSNKSVSVGIYKNVFLVFLGLPMLNQKLKWRCVLDLTPWLDLLEEYTSKPSSLVMSNMSLEQSHIMWSKSRNNPLTTTMFMKIDRESCPDFFSSLNRIMLIIVKTASKVRSLALDEKMSLEQYISEMTHKLNVSKFCMNMRCLISLVWLLLIQCVDPTKWGSPLWPINCIIVGGLTKGSTNSLRQKSSLQ